jgi:lipid-binding SYLF domain-containing protein
VNKILATALCASVSLLTAACSSQTPQQVRLERLHEVEAAEASLEALYEQVPSSKLIADGAAGVLVFPKMTKAGFLIGGQYGKGVLFKHGQPAGYYRSTGISYGLQAGAQEFGYALIFSEPSDLKYLQDSEGWEIGVGPTITVVDVGMANSFTTTTARKGVYVFFYQQKGLMAGLGIQGTKITKE